MFIFINCLLIFITLFSADVGGSVCNSDPCGQVWGGRERDQFRGTSPLCAAIDIYKNSKSSWYSTDEMTRKESPLLGGGVS
jgi:hypothetical protein